MGINLQFIKAEIQDAFELLVCILSQNKKGCDTVEIDENAFIISISYLNKDGSEIGISLRLYEKTENMCVVEFKRLHGEYLVFHQQVKALKEKLSAIIKAVVKSN